MFEFGRGLLDLGNVTLKPLLLDFYDGIKHIFV
jgi:hypothetical protein